MPNTKKFKNTCRLWRVNIDGQIYEGRWKNAGGAVAAALQKHCAAEGYSGAMEMIGQRPEPKDFTDMAIIVECIGPALADPVVEVAKSMTANQAVVVTSQMSAEQQRALLGAWYHITGQLPPEAQVPESPRRGRLSGAWRAIVGGLNHVRQGDLLARPGRLAGEGGIDAPNETPQDPDAESAAAPSDDSDGQVPP